MNSPRTLVIKVIKQMTLCRMFIRGERDGRERNEFYSPFGFTFSLIARKDNGRDNISFYIGDFSGEKILFRV